MKVMDEHAVLRGLEDFRIAGAMEPESPESMRRRLAQHEHYLRLRRQLELDQELRQHALERAERERERQAAKRAEAWLRGDPTPEPEPASPYDPYRDIARAHMGFTTVASCYMSASGAMWAEHYDRARADYERPLGR